MMNRDYISHCDAMVERAVIVHNGLNCTLVDNYSSVDILFGSALDQMQLNHS